ncbi:GntR family transcriptional regulator [Streptomyces sp. NPDC050658]|uniref:GntR family transcriptional regulator n=1 Tax=unclassified Streptomyces TaxID=2593676 RepID=UPI00344A9F44
MTEPRPAVKWRVLADQLRAQIQDGTYPPGATLPQLKAYAADLGVHHETVRTAYKALEKEGLIRTIQRRGSVVLETPLRRRITGDTVTRDPVRGRPTRASLAAPPEVTTALGLAPGAEALRIRRVTSPAGAPPFQLVDTWISPAAVEDSPRIADVATDLDDYAAQLEQAGHGPLDREETLRARMPDRSEAKLLEIATSIPVLESVIVGTSARTGRPVDVTVCLIPGDRVEIVKEPTYPAHPDHHPPLDGS